MAQDPPLLDLDTPAVGTAAAGSAKRKVIISYSNGGEGVRCSTSSSSSCLDCCSSRHGNGSDKEASEFSDLEKESNDISVSTYGGSERRETIAESMDPKAAAAAPRDVNSCSILFNNEEAKVENNLLVAGDDEDEDVNSRRRPRPKKAKTPSNAELEDFFSVTENDLMRQFTHRYNFDFVKEEPLEGRYEWVPVRVSHD